MTTYQGRNFFRDARFPFFIERYTIRKREVIPAHTHDFMELVYVAGGSGSHEMAGRRYELSTGDVFILEPNVYHSYAGSEEEDAIVYNVLFDLDFLKQEFEVLQQMPAFVDFFYLAPFLRRNAAFVGYHPLLEHQRHVLEANLQTILREFLEKEDAYQLLIKTRLIECLVLLSRFHRDNQRDVLPAAGSADMSEETYMNAIARFVELHYNQPITLEQLSRISSMSVSSFTAKFKKLHGQSLISYKQSVQIRHACELLDRTSRKVLDIAHETGFNDISFFNKVFRKHTGLSPRSYRQRRGRHDEHAKIGDIGPT